MTTAVCAIILFVLLFALDFGVSYHGARKVKGAVRTMKLTSERPPPMVDHGDPDPR